MPRGTQVLFANKGPEEITWVMSINAQVRPSGKALLSLLKEESNIYKQKWRGNTEERGNIMCCYK